MAAILLPAHFSPTFRLQTVTSSSAHTREPFSGPIHTRSATSGLFKTIFDLPNVYGDESRLGVARRSEEETVQLGTSELALLSLIRPRPFLTYNGPNDSCIRCGYVKLDSSSWDILTRVMIAEFERRPLGDTLLAMATPVGLNTVADLPEICSTSMHQL